MKQIFIIGVGRSGTSLLQSMFAAHPQVTFMPETAFLRRYVVTGVLQSAYEWGGEAAVIDILQQDEVFARTGIDVGSLLSKIHLQSKGLDAAVYRELISSYATQCKWIGDKDPRQTEFLPLVKSIIPDAHVINIIRDPRDVLASKKKAIWSKDGHVWKHIFANRVQLSMGCQNGSRLFGLNYHEIIYEELITRPEQVLSNLCDEIGLSFDRSMLSFDKAAIKLVSEKEMRWKKETLGPLLPDNKEKWKEQIPPREILLSEFCCREAMLIGGYSHEKLRIKLNTADIFWVAFGVLVIKAATLPYILYRNWKVEVACNRQEK